MNHDNEIQTSPSYTLIISSGKNLIAQYSDTSFPRFNKIREQLEQECKKLIKENGMDPLHIQIYQYL